MTETDPTPRALPEAIKANPEQFQFLADEVVDKLVGTVMELSAQVWTLKRRALITQKLLETKGVVTSAEIETFVPSDEDAAIWQKERDQYVKSVYAPFARIVPLEQPETPSTFLKR